MLQNYYNDSKHIPCNLSLIHILHEVVTDEKSEDIAYQPSMDINKMNVALLLDKLDTRCV